MARKRITVYSMFGPPEPETRPAGSLMFADPSAAEFPRHIHTYNEPYSRRSVGEQNGIRSITGRIVENGARQWNQDMPWEAMSRKRGVTNEED